MPFRKYLAFDFGGTAQPCQLSKVSVPDAIQDIMIPYVYNIIPALYDNPNVAWMKETQGSRMLVVQRITRL